MIYFSPWRFLGTQVSYSLGNQNLKRALFLHKWKFCQSVCQQRREINTEGSRQNSQVWEFNLQNPYGVISVHTQRAVEIDRIDVLEHPGGDYAAFQLKESDSSTKADGKGPVIEYDNAKNKLSLVEDNNKNLSSCGTWIISVPPYYDLAVHQVGDSIQGVQVKNLENQSLTIIAMGDIHIHNIKSRDVTLDSKMGDVKSTKVLQGNAVVRTKKNKGFTADRLQGQKFDIKTEAGNVNCKDIYGNTSVFHSEEGSIQLGNVTGECSVTTKGDVNIGSLDGSLKGQLNHTGSVEAYLVRPETVSLQTENGNITLSLPTDVKGHLDLKAPKVSVSSELNFNFQKEDIKGQVKGILNAEGPTSITASSKEGSITVSMQSWFASLKLGS